MELNQGAQALLKNRGDGASQVILTGEEEGQPHSGSGSRELYEETVTAAGLRVLFLAKLNLLRVSSSSEVRRL